MKWLIGLLVLLAVIAVLVPVVVHSIQNRDFRRQIEGKRPLREADEATALARKDEAVNPELEAEAARMKASGAQNFIGPK